MGAIARDHEGNLLVMVWRTISDCRDAEKVEAMACLEGSKLLERWPEHVGVTIETDCSNIVTKVQSTGRDCSTLSSPIICDIKEIIGGQGDCQVQKVWREQNQIAHNLAKFSLKSRSSRVSTSVVPFCIQELVYCDRFQCRNPIDIT
jgi:hypothetical protein